MNPNIRHIRRTFLRGRSLAVWDRLRPPPKYGLFFFCFLGRPLVRLPGFRLLEASVVGAATGAGQAASAGAAGITLVADLIGLG